MTTHVEHGAIRSVGYPSSGNFAQAIWASFKAWRQERRERAEIEAVAALDPQILDDIGAGIAKAERPSSFVPVLNPYAIVVDAVFAPRPAERDEL
jgi:hypothetical protein